MKILLAIDGSRYAEYAERWMNSLFPIGEYDLSIVTVSAATTLVAIDYEFPVNVEETVSQCHASAESVVENARQRLQHWGKSVGKTVLNGHAADEILKEIESSHPDICVLGSHGRTALDRFLLGSVSDRICKHAKCSLLLVRPTDDNFTSSKCQTIVIADDGSETVKAALQRVAGFNNEGIQIYLVSVIPDFSTIGLAPTFDVESHCRELEQQNRIRLEEYQRQLSELTDDVNVVIRTAPNIADDLVKFADEVQADMIMVGGKKKSALNRILLGSVSLDVLHHAHCSVWIER